MTIATDMGFKIGELYRVVAHNGCSYYAQDMVLRFKTDDDSDSPWFEYVSGPEGFNKTPDGLIAVSLNTLAPAKQQNKSLLLLYIQQQYPDDKVLKALVESL